MSVVYVGHQLGWVVANVLASAVIITSIFVSSSIGDITHAVSESSKGNRRVTLGRGVGESDLEDRNVVNYRRGNGSDEKEDGGN